MSRCLRILTPSIRPFGPTQDRRWISNKPRATLPVRGLLARRAQASTQTGLASALPNIVR
jgi:hypothetical protein